MNENKPTSENLVNVLDNFSRAINLAFELSCKFKIKTFDDLVKMSEYHSIKVEHTNQFPFNVGGKPIEHQNEKYIILNDNHPPEMQTFSLAHELAHYFLEHPIDTEETETYRLEADLFATCIFINNNYDITSKYLEANTEIRKVFFLSVLGISSTLIYIALKKIIPFLTKR